MAEPVINGLHFSALRDLFIKHNEEHPKDAPLTAYIVFKESNWERHYPLKSRTYEISSDNKLFRPHMSSCSLFGSCTDGSDQNLRLDWYMNDLGIRGGWETEYCYLKDGDRDESDV